LPRNKSKTISQIVGIWRLIDGQAVMLVGFVVCAWFVYVCVMQKQAVRGGKPVYFGVWDSKQKNSHYFLPRKITNKVY